MDRPTLDLTRPRDLSQLLGEALRVWWQNLGTFLTLALGVVVTVDLIMGAGLGELSGRYQANPALATVLIEAAISALVTTPLITAMLAHAVVELGSGRRPSARMAMDRGLELFAPVLLAVVIFVLGVLGGLSLFLLPGIFVYVSWYFVTQAVVIDGARGFAAVARSSQLVRGRWLRVLGAVLVIQLSIGLLSYGLELGTSEIARAADSEALDLVGRMVLGALVIPLQAVMATLLYFDLRARQEDKSLQNARPL